MTKLMINESPAAQVVAKASESVQVTDGRGRVITLRKPSVLQQFRLVEILGDTASNETYMKMAFPLLYVSEIDGEEVILAAKKSEFEALVSRLDEDGIEAVMTKVQQRWGKSDPEADKFAVKK